jgi:hypothetical protein
MEMWMLSFSPSWKRIENSFSPISRARRQRSRVERAQISDGRDLLAVLVHQEDELRAGVLEQPLERLADLLELLVIEEKVLRTHRSLTGLFGFPGISPW